MRIKPALPCLFVLLSVQVLAGQEEGGKPPSPPSDLPEVKRIVDSVVGKWTGLMTVNTPRAAPETFRWSIDCRPTALGAGAACTMEGHPSIGALAQACLVACDPWSHAVHYMCVTSMGEVHDHKGRWTDDRTLAFEPLTGVLQGKTMTETITWSFADARSIKTRSVVTLEDGASMSFEFNGSRE